MNRYIQKLIAEQFNIGNMNLNNNKRKNNVNIFNKNNIIDLHDIYDKILHGGNIDKNEIEYINNVVSAVKPKDEKILREIIEFYSYFYPNYSLNWLDVSEITDMNHLFENTKYNGDISKWDVSNVIFMNSMFKYAYDFNQPIGNWDVGNVMNMSDMFNGAYNFNQPIGDWNVSNVNGMRCMFNSAVKFNQPIGDWNVSNVNGMQGMFYCAVKFNQPIGDWDVGNVYDMNKMFYHADSFNQDISAWNINEIVINDNSHCMFSFCPINDEYKPEQIKK